MDFIVLRDFSKLPMTELAISAWLSRRRGRVTAIGFHMLHMLPLGEHVRFVKTKFLSFQNSCRWGLNASYYRPRNRFLRASSTSPLVIECLSHCFFFRGICILEMQLQSPLGYFRSQTRCLFLQEVFPDRSSLRGGAPRYSWSTVFQLEICWPLKVTAWLLNCLLHGSVRTEMGPFSVTFFSAPSIISGKR